MLNPIRIDRYFQEQKRIGAKKKLQFLSIFSIQTNSDFNRTTWKTEAKMKTEKLRQFRSPYWYMINPFSIFIHVWDCLFVIFYLAYLLLLPIRVSNAKLRLDLFIARYQFVIDIFFLICIPINFCTGIYMPLSKTVNYRPRDIAKKYLKGYFIVDLLSPVPCEGIIMLSKSFNHMIPPSAIYMVYIFSYLRLIRFHFFLLAFRKLLFFMHVRGIGIDVVCIIFTWIIVSYLLVTALYYWPSYDAYNLEFLSGEPFAVILFLHNTTGAILTLFQKTINPQTSADIYPLVLSYIAIIVEPFFGAIIIVTFWALKDSDIKYRAVLDEVNAFTLSLSASDQTKKMIRDYFKMYHNQSLLMDDRKSMDFYSGHYHMKILKTLMTKITLHVRLFQDLPPRLRIAMVKELKREVFFTGYQVTTAGQLGTNMYIVSSGKLILITENYTKIGEIIEGSSFGEYQLLADSPYPVTAICAEISVVYSLNRKSFNSVIHHLADIYKDLRIKITERQMNLVLALDRIKRNSGS